MVTILVAPISPRERKEFVSELWRTYKFKRGLFLNFNCMRGLCAPCTPQFIFLYRQENEPKEAPECYARRYIKSEQELSKIAEKFLRSHQI